MRREEAWSPKWDRDEEAEPLIVTPLSLRRRHRSLPNLGRSSISWHASVRGGCTKQSDASHVCNHQVEYHTWSFRGILRKPLITKRRNAEEVHFEANLLLLKWAWHSSFVFSLENAFEEIYTYQSIFWAGFFHERERNEWKHSRSLASPYQVWFSFWSRIAFAHNFGRLRATVAFGCNRRPWSYLFLSSLCLVL